MREAKTRMTFEHFTLNDTFDRLFISIIGDVMIRPEFRGNVVDREIAINYPYSVSNYSPAIRLYLKLTVSTKPRVRDNNDRINSCERLCKARDIIARNILFRCFCRTNHL